MANARWVSYFACAVLVVAGSTFRCGGGGGGSGKPDGTPEDHSNRDDGRGDSPGLGDTGPSDGLFPSDADLGDGGHDVSVDPDLAKDGILEHNEQQDGPDWEVPDEVADQLDIEQPTDGPGCVALHGSGWAWNAKVGAAGGCIDCSQWVTCSAPGSKGVYHTTASDGTCVCETLPDFYFNPEQGTTLPCDSDEDRWVARSAYLATTSSDPVVKFNARCAPVLVWRVGYHPELATAMAADLPMTELVEPDARDVQALLEADPAAPAIHGARAPLAAELNPLTKFCVNADADYNADGLADLSQEQSPALDVDPTVAPFADLTFFVETHLWWLDEEQGTIHIAERPRESAQLGSVPLTAGDGVGEFWRECMVRTDSEFTPESNQAGFDFADVPGMLHHSLFRCVQVVDAAETLSSWSVEVADVGAYHFNRCSLLDPTDTDAVPLACAVVEATDVGSVYMTLDAYAPYGEASGYLRGCVDVCGEGWSQLDTCPGYAASHALCHQDEANFGQPSCACVPRFTGDQCESCANHWTGEQCATCPAPWVGEECNNCPGYWSGEDCTTCAAPYSGYYCDSCAALNFDPATACTSCYRDPILGYYAGEACDVCFSHYFDAKNYVSANLMVNTGGPDGVGNWTTEGGSAMGVWNGETVILHPDYPAIAWQTVDLMANQEVAIMLAQASKHSLELVLEGGVQLAEFTQIEIWLKDAAGSSIAYSSHYCSSIGYVTIEFPQYMPVCQNLNKAVFSGPTLDAARQAVVKLTSYGDLSMYSWKGLHNKVTGATLRLKANYWTPRCLTCTEGWEDSAPGAKDCAVCPIRFAESDPLDPTFQPATCHTCRDDDHGHFTGPTCQQCKPDWSGLQCNVPAI